MCSRAVVLRSERRRLFEMSLLIGVVTGESFTYMLLRRVSLSDFPVVFCYGRVRDARTVESWRCET